MSKKKKPKPGREPQMLKIDGDWKDALKKMLRKKRPNGGWPERDVDSGSKM